MSGWPLAVSTGGRWVRSPPLTHKRKKSNMDKNSKTVKKKYNKIFVSNR